MISRDIQERLRAFLDHADIHLMRGNVEAVREALDDARALVRACGIVDESDVEW